MRGLRNPDWHSCYVNSLVQAIAGVDPLRQACSGPGSGKLGELLTAVHFGEDSQQVYRLQEAFFQTVRTDSKGKFLNGVDQDVQEFAERMQLPGKPAQDLMSVTHSTVRCYKMCGICSTVTSKDDPWPGVLSVAIPGPTPGSPTVTLQQCLVYDFNGHQLLSDYDCTGCGVRGQTMSTSGLAAIPEVMPTTTGSRCTAGVFCQTCQLPPAWEVPVSAVIATVWASCLWRVGLALGHPTWPWGAGLTAAVVVLCFLLPVWSAVRRERQLQMQYQRLLAAAAAGQEGGVDLTATTATNSSSSGQRASTKAAPPAPPAGAGAVARGSATPADGMLGRLLTASHTKARGLYTSAGPGKQLALTVAVEFAAAADDASSSQLSVGGRAAAVLQAAQDAVGLVCATATRVVFPPAAGATPVGQQQQGGGCEGPVGTTSSMYLDLSSMTGSPLSRAGSSTAASGTGVLVQLVAMENDVADRVQLLLVASQQGMQAPLQCSGSTEGFLQDWWAAVQQLLVASVPGVTSVFGGSVTACITHAANQADVTGTGELYTGTDWRPDRSNTGGISVMSGGLPEDAQPQGPVGGLPGSVCDQEGTTSSGAGNSTSGRVYNSSPCPPPPGSHQQPTSTLGCALQWAYQLQWHAPLCLPDMEFEAAGPPEVLLQLSLQPAPGSSVGSNPYADVVENRAYFAVAVGTGSSDGSVLAQEYHPDAPAAAPPPPPPPPPAAASATAAVQSPLQLRGALGDLVTFLVTNEAVTTSWSWCEEEVLGLAAEQQPDPTTLPGGAGAGGGFPVAVHLQLPRALNSEEVHQLVLTHRLPPSSSGECGQGSVQALALVPLCVLPAAAYQEVEQHLLPCMWGEAHAMVTRSARQAGAASGGGSSNDSSSSLQDYAFAFAASSSRGGTGTAPPELAAVESLTWHHWCQLAGDMNRAASLSRLLMGQAAQHCHSPQQYEAVVLCQQELHVLVSRLIGFFMGHRLVSCAVAVLQLLPPDLRQSYRAAVQQQLAAWEAADEQEEQQGQQPEEEERQEADAVQQQQQQQVAGHAPAQKQPLAPGGDDRGLCAAVGADSEAASPTMWLKGDLSNPAATDALKPGCTASASSPSLQDSAFEGATGAGSSCSGPRSVTYSRSSSTGSSMGGHEAI